MTEFQPDRYHVLVVDDSTSLLKGVEATLTQVGFHVSTAASGEEALDQMRQHGLPHLALVDINMPPGMDGFELCQEVHEFSDLPIVMLTAIDEEDTIVQAIDQFAEDYITKPFQMNELTARVRRVLRRIGDFTGPLGSSEAVDPHMTINYPNCLVTVDGTPVSLSPTEMKLLYILMRSMGEIVPTSFILRRLWPMEFPNEGRLRVYVHRLRQKIEISQPKHQYIKAMRGAGYRFTPTANAAADSADR